MVYLVVVSWNASAGHLLFETKTYNDEKVVKRVSYGDGKLRDRAMYPDMTSYKVCVHIVHTSKNADELGFLVVRT